MLRRFASIALLLVVSATPALAQGQKELSRPNAAAGPTPVRVFIFLADVFDVSASDQSLAADVVLNAEWQDPSLAGRWPVAHGVKLDDAEIWHPQLQIVNQRAASLLLPQRLEVDPSGLVRYRQRWSGRFTARMDFRDFPLDTQRFHLQVVSLGFTREEVDLIPDSASERSGRASRFSITDWDLGPARMATADFEPAPGARVLPGVELAWDGQRAFAYYGVQVVLPLVMIVFMGWTALWISPTVVTTRMSVAVTTMLTLIAYRFALAQRLPNLTYLTRFDYFLLGSTVLVFLTLLVLAATAYLISKERTRAVQRIDVWARVAFPAAFAAMCVRLWMR